MVEIRVTLSRWLNHSPVSEFFTFYEANTGRMLARPEHNGLKSVYCFFKQFLWIGKSVPRIIYDRIIKSHSEPILSVKVEIGRDDDNFLLTMRGLPKSVSWLGSHIKSLIAAMSEIEQLTALLHSRTNWSFSVDIVKKD
ncbi:hypothetical protein Tco_0092091 [Tanacetum coccineum]